MEKQAFIFPFAPISSPFEGENEKKHLGSVRRLACLEKSLIWGVKGSAFLHFYHGEAVFLVDMNMNVDMSKIIDINSHLGLQQPLVVKSALPTFCK